MDYKLSYNITIAFTLYVTEIGKKCDPQIITHIIQWLISSIIIIFIHHCWQYIEKRNVLTKDSYRYIQQSIVSTVSR